jgi:Tol biopolymer transport system component
MMMRLRVSRPFAVFVASITMWMVATAPPPASATYPGANGRIAFTARLSRAEGWQLYTMRPDGSARRQLTHIKGSSDISFMPDWSPSGARIVFMNSLTGHTQLYLIRADGSHMHRVFADRGHDDIFPTWSPDGHTIVFSRVSENSIGAALWSVRPDGSHLRRITDGQTDHVGASFTPDGSTIVFDRSGNGIIAAIWRMDADGSNLERLTPVELRAGLPDVSPDGSQVVFSDNQNGHLPTSIWIMNIDGSGLTQLTDAGCCYQDVRPVFSPDGTRILFATDRNSRQQCCFELWSMHLDGSHQLELTSNLTAGGCPEADLGNCSYGDWGTNQG